MDLFKNVNYLKISIVSFVMSMASLMLNTLLPRYANDLGASSTLVGFVLSSFTITAIIFKSLSGPMVDHFNKVRILAFSLAIISVAFLGYSFSTSIYMLIFFRMVQGSGMAFTAVASLSILADIVEKERLMEAVAYYGTFQALSGAVGPYIGLELSYRLGYSMTFLIGLVIMVLAMLISLSIKLKVTQKNRKDFKVELSKSIAIEAIIPASMMIFLAGSYSAITAYITLFADDVNVANIGLFFSVNALSLLISRPILGRLSLYYKEYILLPFAIVMFLAAVLVISYSTTLMMFIFGSVLLAFGYGLCQPLVQTLCMKSVDRSRSGAASATSYYGIDIGYLLSPLVAGYLIDRVGYASMYRSLTLFILFGLVLYFVFIKQLKEISCSV